MIGIAFAFLRGSRTAQIILGGAVALSAFLAWDAIDDHKVRKAEQARIEAEQEKVNADFADGTMSAVDARRACRNAGGVWNFVASECRGA